MPSLRSTFIPTLAIAPLYREPVGLSGARAAFGAVSVRAREQRLGTGGDGVVARGVYHPLARTRQQVDGRAVRDRGAQLGLEQVVRVPRMRAILRQPVGELGAQ